MLPAFPIQHLIFRFVSHFLTIASLALRFWAVLYQYVILVQDIVESVMPSDPPLLAFNSSKGKTIRSVTRLC